PLLREYGVAGPSPRARAVAAAALQADGSGARGGGTHRVTATAGSAAHQGVSAGRPGYPEPGRCLPGRSLPLCHSRTDRGQGGGSRSVAREAQAFVPRALARHRGPAALAAACARPRTRTRSISAVAARLLKAVVN